MKVAIVHDHLTNRGGAEQVTLSFASAFPEAPIFTLAYDETNTYPEFSKFDIKVSCFQKFSKKEKFVKTFFFPLGILAMRKVTIDSSYDVVLMSTTHCAKYVKIAPNVKVFCYAHNPFRLIWYPNTYKQYDKSPLVIKKIFDIIFSYIRKVDFRSMEKVDYLITNSTMVKERLRSIYTNYYGDINIIPPPVRLDNFHLEKKTIKTYYLVVSRLEYYKRVDLVIEAFNISKKPLVIVGDGVQEKELKERASSNIVFYKKVSKEKLANLYANAIALIFPQLEDFGITPLEANASGTPVIAYGRGGVLDTQIPYKNHSENATAIFFNEQTTNSLLAGIKQFELVKEQMDCDFIRNHAKKFAEDNFILRIQDFIKEKASYL